MSLLRGARGGTKLTSSPRWPSPPRLLDTDVELPGARALGTFNRL